MGLAAFSNMFDGWSETTRAMCNDVRWSSDLSASRYTFVPRDTVSVGASANQGDGSEETTSCTVKKALGPLSTRQLRPS